MKCRRRGRWRNIHYLNPARIIRLASRLRPATLEEFVGQKHLLGEGKVLRQLIEQDAISSMIFWGPPGVGKTTLARIIAGKTRANFIDFSAVTSGIKEIRQVMARAENDRLLGEKTILFVDEIHRFNKAQQDAFLPFVEKGSIILIGAPQKTLLLKLILRCFPGVRYLCCKHSRQRSSFSCFAMPWKMKEGLAGRRWKYPQKCWR